jgi:hypothetical protein
VLAAISAHIEHGAVPAHFRPVEIFALIGEELVSRETWSKFHNTARAETKRSLKVRWQRQADAIWRLNLRLSKTAVAKKIAPDQWETVRKAIIKP